MTATQEASAPVTEQELPVVGHWMAGAASAGTSGRTADVFDPATGQVTKKVALASREDADAVIAAAAKAWPAWRDISLARRTQVLFAFRELLNARKGELAEIITSEHGKVLDDALGEVSRGQEIVEFACGLSHLLKGSQTENASTKVDVSSLRQPLGVVGVISPFNFPAMVPMWFFPVAIAAGNTVVLKPSEKDPSASIWLAQIWKEAGLPDGVFNVLQGDKVSVDALLENPAVKAISFVGSTPIARYVYENGTKNGKRVQALGGAKNHMLVLPDADLDLAADAAVNGGFGSAGERCMAVSALVAVDSVADELIGKIADRISGLRTGDGRRGCDMGPLVTGAHRDKVVGYIEQGVEAGAELVVDGRGQPVDGAAEGFWVSPTLFDKVTPEMSIYTDEIFGPVLSVLRVPGYTEGLRADQRQPVRERRRHLHQRRRCGQAIPERGRGRHGGHQRARSCSRRVLLVRRLEEFSVRRHPCARSRGLPFLHPRQGHHHPLARSEPRRNQSRIPAERLTQLALGHKRITDVRMSVQTIDMACAVRHPWFQSATPPAISQEDSTNDRQSASRFDVPGLDARTARIRPFRSLVCHSAEIPCRPVCAAGSTFGEFQPARCIAPPAKRLTSRIAHRAFEPRADRHSSFHPRRRGGSGPLSSVKGTDQ